MIQIFINSIISGLLLALVALGFNIIFTATRIFHLTHGAMYVLGVYVHLLLSVHFALSVFISIPIALMFVAFAGYLTEVILYLPLMKKTINQNIALISSLAAFLIVVNIIAVFAGNDTKMLSQGTGSTIEELGLTITQPQLLQVCVSIPVIVTFMFFILRSGLGLKIRAVADNPTLAKVIGIKINTVRNTVFILGSVMAAIAGLLRAYDTGIDPYSGMSVTLIATVAVILGGNGSLYGTLFASIALSILQAYTEYFLTSQWREPVVFVILIAVLLWRTEGIVQFNVRTDER